MTKRSFCAIIALVVVAGLVFSALSTAFADKSDEVDILGDFVCDCSYEAKNNWPFSLSKSQSSVVERIVDSVRRPGMTEFELAVALNDWLMDNTQYKSHKTNALNVLIHGYASCSGYANAYCLLLDEAGIGNKRIAGRVYRYDHVWNLVRMDGNWYHVDVRMNDSTNSHMYFGLTHEAMEYCHQNFSHSRECDSYECNYDYKTGALDESIAYIKNAINESFSKGEGALIINLLGNCPAPLKNPVQRLMIKRIIEAGEYEFEGAKHKVNLIILDGGIAISVDFPFIKVSSVTLDQKKVKMKVPDLSVGHTFRLSVSVLPLNASKPVVFWRSRNERVATVDQTGLVKIVGYGTAKVMAMAEDGSKQTGACVVTVKKK